MLTGVFTKVCLSLNCQSSSSRGLGWGRETTKLLRFVCLLDSTVTCSISNYHQYTRPNYKLPSWKRAPSGMSFGGPQKSCRISPVANWSTRARTIFLDQSDVTKKSIRKSASFSQRLNYARTQIVLLGPQINIMPSKSHFMVLFTDNKIWKSYNNIHASRYYLGI